MYSFEAVSKSVGDMNVRHKAIENKIDIAIDAMGIKTGLEPSDVCDATSRVHEAVYLSGKKPHKSPTIWEDIDEREAALETQEEHLKKRQKIWNQKIARCVADMIVKQVSVKMRRDVAKHLTDHVKRGG